MNLIIWSYTGQGDTPDVNATFLQPFLSFTTKTYTTFALNTESTYDWDRSEWTVPVNLTIAQLLKIGGHPIQFQIGYRYYAERPNGHGPQLAGPRFRFLPECLVLVCQRPPHLQILARRFINN
jgi:hypothetical protein